MGFLSNDQELDNEYFHTVKHMRLYLSMDDKNYFYRWEAVCPGKHWCWKGLGRHIQLVWENKFL